MDIRFSQIGEQDFGRLDNSLRILFKKHMQKLMQMPPRRHLRNGNPYFCENVNEQARLVYQLNGEEMLIIHCFGTHKEYERWLAGKTI
ncbi:MAG: hypothetical protein V1728_03715 [Candidatus Micrarchaeota archaeon]